MAVDLEKLEGSPHLLDILIQMEDVLDSLDVYVFENWIKGEIVDGPKVRRYWLDMTLKYPYEEMPDPKAALRLLKHGVRVDYKKVSEEDAGKEQTDEAEDDAKDEKDKSHLVWLVTVSIPRRLIVEINAGELDFYDDEIDVDDVEDANDEGMNDETGYTADGQNGEAPPGDGQAQGQPAPDGGDAAKTTPPMGGKPNG